MAVFISYSHADKEKIDKIAGHLVRKRASVWVDRWELKPGDSLINRIQEAVEGSSALLIMLSPASVDSGWCKRELTAGLLRELEEKRVVTIPVLLEDCNIPLFLRDKMYADFRTDFDAGMNALLEAVAGHANPDQSRIEDVDGYLDWSTDWGEVGGRIGINYTLVQNSSNTEMTFLTQIFCVLGDAASARYRQYQELGIDWMFRTTHALSLRELAKGNDDMFIILEDTIPKTRSIMCVDPKTGSDYEVKIVCRKMGNDNGKDQLLNVTEYLERIIEFTIKTNRNPTPEELEKLKIITATPWPRA
ncbi:toll/interleukin-1 receptor domain-containing protein [Pseudomonas aeruginosa]|nr:toll/interleukin-1 receptor domain-containing protein [Pseudomonas aeruginosa]MCT4981035.1 toll/interleukin-1 receptor domain-containing protein [Pseudomonas aeruginosa]HBO6310440.1 toll/interleukin-1 receptor domain-containing protein [Pseudomonas aeruginosa]HEK2227697.1 toll/interleukin-1 receptor domain-containing protein [Pseudomonas aeruginosa]HEK2300175.1 toll/interleukin-1 receptor domain-containing protein [Pseudomonas aeruginosa]